MRPRTPQEHREYERAMTAAGYDVPKFRRRRPKIKIDTNDPELLHREKLRILNVTLDSVGGHRAKAAELLGITPRTVYRWLRESRDLLSCGLHNYMERV